MNVPHLALPVTSELFLPCVYGTTVVFFYAFLLPYDACSVSKSFCFHSNGELFLPPVEPRLRYGSQPNNSNHVLYQCGAWPLGRLVSCRHFFFFSFPFRGYVAFVLRSTAIRAVCIPVFTL